MSSSPISSSSSEPVEAAISPFAPFFDLVCPVTVHLGTGTVTVRRLLTLERNSVLRLSQAAGDELLILMHGTPLARAEVVIIEDSTSVRVTEILPSMETPGEVLA
ncbi:MAG TPA: FliM/FliN family flagellar motor switch protein [Vicinamibacterales bacterium]|nr:FliM/FliN family flagellar motor switch protein [Vicinamibacterales bacterium]